jgi:S-adenosylhomocysteine hydrolase
MRKIVDRLNQVCLREKSHLIVAGGYLTTTFWHSSAVMSAAYGAAALMATHVIHRTSTDDANAHHTPKHRRSE